MKKVDKLAQDASAAIKAGMSYGKYMAMKNPVVIEKDEGLICQRCGKVFHKRYNKEQKYCSPECQERAKWKRKNERHGKILPRIVVCARCGKEFESTHSPVLVMVAGEREPGSVRMITAKPVEGNATKSMGQFDSRPTALILRS